MEKQAKPKDYSLKLDYSRDSAVARASSIASTYGDKYSKIKQLFEIGKLVQPHGELTIPELQGIVRISTAEIKDAVAIVSYFEGSYDAFIDYLVNNNVMSIAELKRKILKKPSRKRYPRDLMYPANLKHDVLLAIEQSDEMQIAKYTMIRDVISSLIPVKMQLVDQEYFKYAECAVCHAEPPDSGQVLLLHPESEFVLVPVCQQCELGLNYDDVDYKYLMLLYAAYAHHTEVAYYKIVNAI